ncbi:MAG: hypothetical protein R3F43_02180 [bacterium]
MTKNAFIPRVSGKVEADDEELDAHVARGLGFDALHLAEVALDPLHEVVELAALEGLAHEGPPAAA